MNSPPRWYSSCRGKHGRSAHNSPAGSRCICWPPSPLPADIRCAVLGGGGWCRPIDRVFLGGRFRCQLPPPADLPNSRPRGQTAAAAHPPAHALQFTMPFANSSPITMAPSRRKQSPHRPSSVKKGPRRRRLLRRFCGRINYSNSPPGFPASPSCSRTSSSLLVALPSVGRQPGRSARFLLLFLGCWCCVIFMLIT